MNLEPSGAAFAAYHRGKLVADLYGGYSDKDKKLPWREETMTILFSTTKVYPFFPCCMHARIFRKRE